jgi:hypothetical protein
MDLRSHRNQAPTMTIARPIPGYKGLVETCRQRADELGISRLELDRLAGLPAGYSGKLLGKDGAGEKQKKNVAYRPGSHARHPWPERPSN